MHMYYIDTFMFAVIVNQDNNISKPTCYFLHTHTLTRTQTQSTQTHTYMFFYEKYLFIHLFYDMFYLVLVIKNVSLLFFVCHLF